MVPLKVTLLLYVAVDLVNGFVVPGPRAFRIISSSKEATTTLCMVDNPCRNVQVPLLDLLDGSEAADTTIIPLPSAHLPTELSTPFIYGMQLSRPIHKLLLEEATQGTLVDAERLYGHLVWKNDQDSLVGAVGCTAEVLVNAPTSEVVALNEGGAPTSGGAGEERLSNDATDDTTPTTVLCRGSFRFVVKEVIKTIPYPVALVDELVDDDGAIKGKSTNLQDDEDDDYDYNDLSTQELLHRTLRGIQNLVSQKLEEAESQAAPTPLEQSILEDSGVMPLVDPTAAMQSQVEEIAAVWDIFQTSLIDDILPQDRNFAVAMMAAELADMPNVARQRILMEENSISRLRFVLQKLEETVGMTRARKMATRITDEADEDSKDLKVGQPQLPPWSKKIRSGTRIEYFWSEQDGWLSGEVAEEPVLVLDELIVTVKFDDGEIHRLPFAADEKVRWRPG